MGRSETELLSEGTLNVKEIPWREQDRGYKLGYDSLWEML